MKYFLFVLCSFNFCISLAQSDDYGISDTIYNDFGLFEQDEILKLSLYFDVKAYTRKKPKDEYLNALLVYHFSENDSVSNEIKIKSRGAFRNEYCTFPPLKLNFKKAKFKYSDVNEISTMKLVTHCNYSPKNTQYIFKEYMVYKLYNLISDISFRVRLVQINYIDTGKKKKTISHYGFFIEPLSVLGERLNLLPTKVSNVSQKHIQPDILDRVAIFQYMVGNTDWSVYRQHNTKVLTPIEPITTVNGVLIPYDFDYCGLVNASYAVPSEDSKIRNVTERYYAGLCREDTVLQNALLEFLKKRDDMHNYINSFDHIEDRVKKQVVSYLDSFFQGIENGKTVKHMKSTCLK
ncbi:hypothetical protein [Carboxylicivirga sp. RSCT41]|uniref:hypothetical protein n=1 Tax=Carboxylicivirga agarovorans TaxID=3417570 RepID=UPI003D340A81